MAGLLVFTGGFSAAHATASAWVGACALTGRAQATALYNVAHYSRSALFGWLLGYVWAGPGWPGVVAAVAGLAGFVAVVARVALPSETAGAFAGSGGSGRPGAPTRWCSGTPGAEWPRCYSRVAPMGWKAAGVAPRSGSLPNGVRRLGVLLE